MFDVALHIKSPAGDGMTKSEAMDLIDMLSNTRFQPIKIVSPTRESAAVGFVSEGTPVRANGMDSFIKELLVHEEKRSEDCEYTCAGFKIWLADGDED